LEIFFRWVVVKYKSYYTETANKNICRTYKWVDKINPERCSDKDSYESQARITDGSEQKKVRAISAPSPHPNSNFYDDDTYFGVEW
jgi:hypothetical protein